MAPVRSSGLWPPCSTRAERSAAVSGTGSRIATCFDRIGPRAEDMYDRAGCRIARADSRRPLPRTRRLVTVGSSPIVDRGHDWCAVPPGNERLFCAALDQAITDTA